MTDVTSLDETRAELSSKCPSFGEILAAMEVAERHVLMLGSMIATFAASGHFLQRTHVEPVQLPRDEPGRPPARVTELLPGDPVPEDFGMPEALPDSAAVDRVVRKANRSLQVATTRKPAPPRPKRRAPQRGRRVKRRRKR